MQQFINDWMQVLVDAIFAVAKCEALDLTMHDDSTDVSSGKIISMQNLAAVPPCASSRGHAHYRK